MSLTAALGWSLGALPRFSRSASTSGAPIPVGAVDVLPAFGRQAAAYLAVLSPFVRCTTEGAPLGTSSRFDAADGLYALQRLSALPWSCRWTRSTTPSWGDTRWPCPTPFPTFSATGAIAGPALLMALVVVTLGPIVEELFFRGALFGSLQRRYPPYLAIGWTAAMFAAAHVTWQRFVPIAIAGLVLGVVRFASGSTVPAVVVHMAINGTSLWLPSLESLRASEHGPPLSWAAGSGVLALILLGLLAYWARKRARLASDPNEMSLG